MTSYFDKIVEKALMESMPAIEREQLKLFQKLDSLDEKSSEYLAVNEQLIKLINKQKRTQKRENIFLPPQSGASHHFYRIIRG